MRRKRSVVTSRARPSARPPARVGPGQASSTQRSPQPLSPLLRQSRPSLGVGEVDLSVDLAPRRPGALLLANPVLAASGPFGYGVEYAEIVDVERLGAICSKGTTLEPRAGNVPPRMVETPAAILNSIGLQNPGVDAVLERYAPEWAHWRTPVIVNVAGDSVEEYVAIVERLDGVAGVAGIELNISCPNVGHGGLQFALDRDAAGELTGAVRRVTELPLMVKLSPAASDARAIAEAVTRAGADAISACNTLPGLAIDRSRRRPLLGNTYGGMSGPALKPIALRVVFEIAQVVDVPIVGIGGIGSLEDVIDYLMAGATAVAVGTALFADPALPVRLIDELAAHCASNGLSSPCELVGAALPARRSRPSAKGVEYRP